MSRRAVVLFILLGVLWGIPYLLIKVAVGSFTPATVVMLRTAIGAVLLVPLAIRQGAFAAVRRHWGTVAAYTVVEILIPWTALTHAETVLPSGLAALLLAAVPLVALAISALSGRPERLGVPGWAGLALGTTGVALLVGREIAVPSGEGAALALAEMVLVAVGYALGPHLVATRLRDVPSSGVIATSLALPAVALAPVGIAQWPARVDATALGCVVALGVLCTAAAFTAFFALVAEVGAVRTTLITYLNPAVAVLAGALVLGEPVTWLTVLGFVGVVGGSVLVQRRPRRGEQAPEASAAA